MTKTQIMQMAHAEARKIVSRDRVSYAQAMVFGLRRAHSAAQKTVFVAVVLARPAAPAFMFLRGL